MLKGIMHAVGSFVRCYLIYPWLVPWRCFSHHITQWFGKQEELTFAEPNRCKRFVTTRCKSRMEKGKKIPAYYVLHRCKHKVIKNGYCRQHQRRK